MSVSVKDANGEAVDVTTDANTAYVVGELDADTLAHFTNKRDAGNLTISKTVSSDWAEDAEKTFKFTVQLIGQNITQIFITEKTDKNEQTTTGALLFTTGKATFDLQDGESIRIKGLPVGVRYTVSETRDDGFTTTSEGATDTISSAPSEATFTNTRKTGNLQIIKRVESDAATDKNDKTFTFTVTLTDKSIGDTTKNPDGAVYGGMTFKDGVAEFTLKHGESKLAEGLPTGMEYTVTETADDGFITTVRKGTQADTNGNSVSDSVREGLSSVTFTNTRKQGALTVTKFVEGSATDKGTPFPFKVTLGHRDSDGKFVVDKSIGDTTENPDGKTYRDLTFKNGEAEITLTNGQTAIANGLPRGLEYVVEEVLDDELSAKFETSVTDETGAEAIGVSATGTINENGSAVTFKNTRATGDLTVSKAVADENALSGDKDIPFEFTVTLSEPVLIGENGEKTNVTTFPLKHGERKTISLPIGVHYTVEETQTNGFEPDSAVKEGDISATESVAAFTNTRRTGSLTVSKTVADENALSGDKDISFEFTVTLSEPVLTDENGEKTNVTTFPLKRNESKTITGLPVGVRYTVEETPDYRFTPNDASKEGDISEDGSAVTFINTRKEQRKVILRKVVGDSSNYESLDGATFNLYSGATLLGEFASQDNGIFWIGKLPYGDYRLEETVVPSEAKQGNWQYQFTVGATGVTPSPLFADP